jgi:hypothetical protein
VGDVAAGFPVHRSGGGVLMAWVWIAGVAVVVASVLWTHTSVSAIGGALVVASTAGPAYVWGLRPRLQENPDGLLVANPLRDVFVPWPALMYARVRYVLELWTVDGTAVSVFAVPRESPSQRFRRRGMGGGLPFLGPSPARDPAPSATPGVKTLSAPEQLAYDLNERVERAVHDVVAEPVTQGWSPVALRALAASAAIAVLGLLTVTL